MIPDELHQRLKVACAKSGLKMRYVVTAAVEKQVALIERKLKLGK
jgi:hypothetical protein